MCVDGLPLVVWLSLWVLCMVFGHAAVDYDALDYDVPDLILLDYHTRDLISLDLILLDYPKLICIARDYNALDYNAVDFIALDSRIYKCVEFINTYISSFGPNDIHFALDFPLETLFVILSNNILDKSMCICDPHEILKHDASTKPSTELTVAGLPVKPAAKPKSEIGLTTIITAVLPMLLFSVYMYCVYFPLRDSPYPPERDDFDDFESESQNDDTQIHCPLRKRIWQLIHDDVQILVPHLRAPQSVLTNRLAHMMEQLHYEHTIQETLTLQVNMDNKLPRGAQGKISPAKKLRVQKSVQGEGVEVIEILTETDDDSAQKTIPLILPPLIMCSAPRMIKASGREALAVCLPGNQTTDNENQNNELQVQVSDLEVNTSDPEIETSHLEVQANEYKHLNSELEVLFSESEGQIVLDPAEPFVGPSHSEVSMCERSVSLAGQREPLVLLKKLRIHLVGPKIFTRNPERFSCPTVNSTPGPHRSIEEHCTATNLSSVQRKYVGLWRPNERCL